MVPWNEIEEIKLGFYYSLSGQRRAENLPAMLINIYFIAENSKGCVRHVLAYVTFQLSFRKKLHLVHRLPV